MLEKAASSWSRVMMNRPLTPGAGNSRSNSYTAPPPRCAPRRHAELPSNLTPDACRFMNDRSAISGGAPAYPWMKNGAATTAKTKAISGAARMACVLIILAGLPGTGKTTIARELARQLRAVHVRIDSIEQAIRESGVVVASLYDAGYRAAYAVAEDNLRLGHTVIADSVNPLTVTRKAWVHVANRAQVASIEVEVICSVQAEHRRRVETRATGIPGFNPPTWPEVVAREYHPWDRERIVIDTARGSVEDHLKTLRAAVAARTR